MKRVLVLHRWGMGDMILATPMLKSLFLSGFRVDLVINSEVNYEVIEDAPFINHIYLIKNNWEYARFFLRYDYLVATAGTNPLKVKKLNYIIQAKEVLALSQERDIHRIDMNLKVVEKLLSKVDKEPYIKVIQESVFLKKYLKSGKNIGFSIGSTANQKFKRWGVKRYIALIERLEGNKLVFIGPDELELEKELLTLDVNVVKCSLKESVKLISALDLMVGNDNGLMHIAYATKTATVTLFGMTNEKETGSYRQNSTALSLEMECRPCFDSLTDRVGCDSYECLVNIELSEVIKACQKYL